ncbi:hypothetical protein WA026_001399 [Henosepilachna vigintioctopunctata]|uniref:Uncharacterized protein n=1 Tax=Henosepilachna vigintioctopunctata TaxID=420089 RepID=A0AAW1URV6_9CUCU
MDDFKDLYDDRCYRRKDYDKKYWDSNLYNKRSYLDSNNYGSKFCRNFPSEKIHMSQSTLCMPQRPRNHSKSTLHMPTLHRDSSKSTVCSPYQQKDIILDKNMSNLPYYIVPVLYVPHKPLYEAKQIIEPHVYKAYHCKSKNQLTKGCRGYSPKVSTSRSLLNVHSRKNHKEFEFHDVSKGKRNDNYSFEYYDEYFKKYVEGKRSSSDISFCSEKSFSQLPSTPKRSAKFTDENCDLNSDRRKSIYKDFPELFGLDSAKNTAESLRPRTSQEKPTWDYPRTADVLIETELAAKSCISAQTSFQTLKLDTLNKKKDTHGTQTLIKDVKKNVLVVPNDKFKRSIRREPIPEEVPRSAEPLQRFKYLKTKFSDGQLDCNSKLPLALSRCTTPRYAVSKLTKSAVPSSFGDSKKNSRRSLNSDNGSIG